MPKSNWISKLAKQISDALPDHLGEMKKDFEKNCCSLLSKTLVKFDLVSREEFDAQTKVLERARKKLETLESHLKTLESKLRSKHH